MNKKITMILATIMMALTVVVVLPKTEVKASTVNYAALGFDEAIAYWSSTPLFNEIYTLEVAKSDYAQVTKDNKVNYFKASLVDAVNRPDSVKGPRPLTYQFMMDMLKLSNPNFVNIIRGNQSGTNSALRIQVETEVGYFIPNAPSDEKGKIAADLVGKLNSCGVTTLADYDVWKYYHGGLTAFEVWYSGYTWCSPCGIYPYGYYWNGYYWDGYNWVAQLRAANYATNMYYNTVYTANYAAAEAQQVIANEVNTSNEYLQSTLNDVFSQVTLGVY